MSNIVNLENFADGALTEKFNTAYKEVLGNILNPNTEFKFKRKLTLELEFIVSEDRELSIVDISTKTKLAPLKSVATKILIDRDGKGGVIASEYTKQLKGQQYMKVDEDTGEVLTGQQENKNVDITGIKLVK